MQKKLETNCKINVLMLSAGAISGSFRMMIDIIENANKQDFAMHVAYKPECAEWGDDELNLLIDSGAKIVPLRGRRLFDPKGFIDLRRSLHKEQIDILHSWDVLGVPARIIGRLCGVKVVEELLNPPPRMISQISFKHYVINKLTSVLVHGYVACSHGIMQKYQEQKPVCLRGKRLSVVPNCVDVPDLDMSGENISRLKGKYNLGNQELVLTNIGYFNEQKAQTDLLYAFREVVSQRPDVRLIVVGWGRLESELKQLARHLQLQGRIIFTGKLDRPNVFEILSITDLFVLSSHWEGFGIVLTEAMAVGKPVISTDTDGSREIVVDGKTGIIVPVKNQQSLAEAILSLLAKPDLMVQMGEEGSKRVAQYFNCKKFIRGYENFYNAVFSTDYKSQ